MSARNDPAFLKWSAEHLLGLIREQEGRRTYLEKKAMVWCAGLLSVVGVAIPATVDAPSSAAVHVYFFAGGLLVTLATFVAAFRVIRSRSTIGVRALQFAGKEILVADVADALAGLNSHLLEVHDGLVIELNEKGLRVIPVQCLALVGASCYLTGAFFAAAGL